MLTACPFLNVLGMVAISTGAINVLHITSGHIQNETGQAEEKELVQNLHYI